MEQEVVDGQELTKNDSTTIVDACAASEEIEPAMETCQLEAELTEPVIDSKSSTPSEGSPSKVRIEDEVSEDSLMLMDASTSSAPRRVLKTTSDEDRQRIITAYESGATPASIANMLNINKSTVYGIIKRYKDTWQIESKKRGGHRAKSLSSEAVDSIRVWIDEDCTITLKALAEKVFQQYGVRVAASTIAKEVKEFNYSFK
ncbi:uncharacterized protein LOC128297668 [Anopheles moucheti]|uniref:uncharacterized protein LOC128297668 n=1 Tax=Anopheles moucheti TaxID=186751 RepID=UPI0022F05FE8|nr:uncharacterized protein LOC128297668 [Anopheles moucheti]